METIRHLQKKYCSRALTAAILIGFVLILSGFKPWGKGIILGTLFSVINFVLMGETIPMKLGKSKPKTFILSLGSIVFRYALLAVPLVIAVKFENFNLPAAVIGIFMVQITIFVDHFLGSISLRGNKRTY